MYFSLYQIRTKEFLLTKNTHTQFLEWASLVHYFFHGIMIGWSSFNRLGGTTTPELQSLRDSTNSCVFQEDNALPHFHGQVTDCFTFQTDEEAIEAPMTSWQDHQTW